MTFDRETANRLEAWYRTETGRECFRLYKALILRLVRPRSGERLLDVGCGPGIHLQVFKREGLDVTGLDPSPSMLDLAEARLGGRAGLFPGRAEDLPFEDNEFDIVTLLNTLEFVEDPEAAIVEAVRVARSRIFVGVLNSLSIGALTWGVKKLLDPNLRFRSFSLWELSGLIRRLTGQKKIQWATVGVLPQGLVSRASSFEAAPLLQRCPFGAFLGMAADVFYTTRTDNLAVKTGLKFRPKTAPTPSPTAFEPFGPGRPPQGGFRPRPYEEGR